MEQKMFVSRNGDSGQNEGADQATKGRIEKSERK
jgi:hypothetical protein